ncbi:hypothetical protein [Gallaecimonas pentaromativorans]|uniref:Uncharacterized protein n=1 Tax=Gallaecimonas pentaromativorans TaxID=584787 RepID=A0A3N1Q0K9_9GAMM|nr:hypothetical protein [Gallaecimonas pentaromativorans]ROQ30366.1 hypothetical protein EDC28_10152 [Gallaecimonas pentaromativorans]
MGFWDLFRKKEEGDKANLPSNIQQLSNSLSKGQMVPIRTDLSLDGKKEAFLSFLIKECDENIELLRDNPNVEVSYGGVTFNFEEKVFVLYLLVRIEEKSEMTYETAFSLSQSEMYEDCEAFSKQNGIQIIVSGEQRNKVIVVKMDMIHLNIAAVIKLAEDKTSLNWSIEKFMECVGFIQSQTSNPEELWYLLQNAGGFIEVNTK